MMQPSQITKNNQADKMYQKKKNLKIKRNLLHITYKQYETTMSLANGRLGLNGKWYRKNQFKL